MSDHRTLERAGSTKTADRVLWCLPLSSMVSFYDTIRSEGESAAQRHPGTAFPRQLDSSQEVSWAAYPRRQAGSPPRVLRALRPVRRRLLRSRRASPGRRPRSSIPIRHVTHYPHPHRYHRRHCACCAASQAFPSWPACVGFFLAPPARFRQSIRSCGVFRGR